MTYYASINWTAAAILLISANVSAFAQSGPRLNVDVAQPQRAIDQLQTFQERSSAPKLAVATDAKLSPDSKPLFKLRSVVFEGGVSIPSASFKETYSSLMNKQVSATDLSTITTAITQRYRDAGWHLSRAIIRPQNADAGRLVITIIEGEIAEVQVRGNAAKNPAIQEILASVTHERPSLRSTVERKLLLASDLPGVRIAETSLEELGASSGRFRLIVDAESWNNYTSVSVDNRGTNAVGPYQSYFATNFNSIFKPGDTLGAAFSASTDLNELKFGRFTYSTPIGYDGARLSVLAAHSSVKPGDFRREFDNNVRADFLEVRGSVAPVRTQAASLWLSGAVSFGEYSELDVFGKNYVDHLRIVSGTAEYHVKDDIGGWNYLTINAKFGLPIFGATVADDPWSSRGSAAADFAKLEGYFSRIQTLTGPWSLKLSAATQLATGPLLLSQQFYLGAAFGRGFFGLEYSRDNAAAGSIELRFDQTVSGGLLKSYQLYGYIDHTTAWDVDSNLGDLHLSLAGVGARLFMLSSFQASIEVAVPINYNASLLLPSDPRVFFGLSKSFKLCPSETTMFCG